MPRAAAQRRVVPFAGRGVHQRAVALLLQVAAWGVEVRDERVRGRGLERQLVERAGAGHGFLMSPYRSALGAEQIVPAVDLIQMRPLDELDIVAHPDRAGRLRLQPHRRRVELGQRDAVELMLVFTMVPRLLHQIFAAVVVVEQAGVESDAVQTKRLRPRPADVLGGRQVVDDVLERTVDDMNIGIDDPEPSVRIGQVGRPYAAGRRIAAHVKLFGAQGVRQRVPMHHVFGFVQADAGEPFECGVRDVIGVSDADHRRIRMEAGEHRIGDLHGLTIP